MDDKTTSSVFDRWFVSKLYQAIGGAPVRILLWDGWQTRSSYESSVGTITIKDRAALVKLAIDPELYFGEGYSEGRIEVNGDLVQMLVSVYEAMVRQASSGWHSRLEARWLDRIQANTPGGSRRNIHKHYDIRTDFYKLWLDSNLQYTCAYFQNPNDTLEDAQIAKMDYVCRKVQLQHGEQVVEAGCGWGALALHMARFYGVRVKAFNISHEQIVYARQLANEEGLTDRVEFIEDDYRNITGKFDAFVSVGMLEHVGFDHYQDLGEVIHRSLKDSGRGFLHFIGRSSPRRLNSWIRKRIFPGAYPPTLRQVAELLEKWDFSLLDVENLRQHYARTLEHWLERFERSTDRIMNMFGPEFVRAWRLYLSGSIAAFRAGGLQLFQMVFTPDANSRIPWTREYLYADRAQEQEPQCIPAMY